MVFYVAKRVVLSLPILFIVTVIVFVSVRLLPGDPVDALYSAEASVSEVARAALRHELGLDQPLPVQYVRWLSRILSGDLGMSIRMRQPVLALIVRRAGATLPLVAWSTLLALAIAIPIGTLAAQRRGSPFDYAAVALALLGLSIPGFALGTFFALVFGVWLRLVPTAGSITLPIVTLGITTAGILVRNVRSSMLDELGRDYVRTARGKGLSAGVVLRRHILPNALPVTVSVLAVQIGYLLGGTVVIEQVFAWPGLGLLLFDAVGARDYAVVQGVVLFIAAAYVFINLTADIIRAALDPRIR